MARGRKLTKRDQARLAELFGELAREMASVRLHQDRISDLVAGLEREQRRLLRLERELAAARRGVGVTAKALIERHAAAELDPRWLATCRS